MAKVTKSLRMDAGLAERLDAYAKTTDQKLTSLMEGWISAGLDAATGTAKPAPKDSPRLQPSDTITAAGHVGDLVPYAGNVERKPTQKGASRPRRWA